MKQIYERGRETFTESAAGNKNIAPQEILQSGTLDKETHQSGSSGQREMCTFFTAVFYLLSKKTRLPHYLLNYSGLNEFEYVERRYRAVLTSGFGNNFDLDKRFYKEIWKKGLYWK